MERMLETLVYTECANAIADRALDFKKRAVEEYSDGKESSAALSRTLGDVLYQIADEFRNKMRKVK